jgi:hypothetical protein
MQFSRFLLSDDESSFTANVGVGNKALNLQGIKLYHRQALWLEGDALLPLDVWNAWPNTTLAKLLDDQTVSKINLTAYNLGLREASLLTGWKFPIEGIVLGNLVAEGPLHGLKTSGKLTLNKAQIPLGGSGALLTDVNGEVAFEGPTVLVKKFTGRHATGDFTVSGQIALTDVRDPSFDLTFVTQKTSLNFFESGTATIAANTKITGPLSGATVSGETQILSFTAVPPPAREWYPESRGSDLSPIFLMDSVPWSAWKLDLRISTPQPAPAQWKGTATAGGTIEAKLHLTGFGALPALAGEATFRGLPVNIGHSSLQLEEATLGFREGFGEDPSLLARLSGAAFGEPFSVQITGSFQHPMRFFLFAPPLTEKIIRTELDGVDLGPSDEQLRITLLVPAELFEGVELADWAAISTPPPVPVLPAPAPGANQ